MGTRKMQNRPAPGKGGKSADSTGGEAPGDKAGKPPQGKKPVSDFAMHEHIGGQLRAIFDELVKEPVPDKFRELLDELERKQPKR